MKLSISDLKIKKKNDEKITFITSYEYQMARLAEQAGIDLILVGDSVGNNMLGYKDTRPVTMDEMITFAKAARRGAPNTFLIGDMPLGSYQQSNEDAINNALRFIKEAECDAVKCEGGIRVYDRVKAMIDSGIAVMGHIGYTPQSTNLYTVVQAQTLQGFKILYQDANSLQRAGAFSILLEATPDYISGKIRNLLEIPIYGIGAGNNVDGVLAIVHDVIGLGTFQSKFAKRFCDANSLIEGGIRQYIEDVKSGTFPGREHFYSLRDSEQKKLDAYLKSRRSTK